MIVVWLLIIFIALHFLRLQGIETLVPFISSSCVLLTLEDLILVLKEPNPLTSQLAKPTQEALGLLGESHSYQSTFLSV